MKEAAPNTHAAPVVLFFLLVTAWMALCLFPYDSDGAFALNDGIWTGIGAERYPAGSISPHHPLFHVLVIGVVPLLRLLDIDHPGHVAARVVAGLGAVWLLLQIVAFAGSRRVIVGGLFALVILATRGFIVETAAGENAIPAAAAALYAVRTASRARPDLVRVGIATTLALLLRQDNLFILPGVAVGVAMGVPRGTRGVSLVKVLAATGVMTALGYSVAWLVATDGAPPLLSWLSGMGTQQWSGSGSSAADLLVRYSTSIAIAMTGAFWQFGEQQPWLGLGFLSTMVAAGLALRGSAPRLAIGLPVLVTLIGRAIFHAWFEGDNFEWLLLPIAFVAAFSSGLARGVPATRPWLRCVAVLLLLGTVAAMLSVHAPSTWRLRERRLMSAVKEAVAPPRAQWRTLVQGQHGAAALVLLEVPYTQISTRLGPWETFEAISSEVSRYPTPTVVIVAERIVSDGMPWSMRHPQRLRRNYDGSEDTAVMRFLRQDGLISAVLITPPTSALAPASR